MLIASAAVTFREGGSVFLLLQTLVSVAPSKVVDLTLSFNASLEGRFA